MSLTCAVVFIVRGLGIVGIVGMLSLHASKGIDGEFSQPHVQGFDP